MELTNAEIFNAREPFEKLLACKMPVKTSYALVKMVSKLNEQIIIIEKVRSKLVQTYGVEDEKRGGFFKVTADCPGYSEFLKEFGELMGQKVDIKIEVVSLPDTLEIEPAVLMALERFVKV